MRWLHWLFHSWVAVRKTNVTTYYQCRHCRARRFEQIRGLAGPVDWQWLREGRWKGEVPRSDYPGEWMVWADPRDLVSFKAALEERNARITAWAKAQNEVAG